MLTIPSAPIDDRVKLHQLVKSGLIHHKDDGKDVGDGINDGIKAASDGIKVADDGITPLGDGIKAKISGAVKKTSRHKGAGVGFVGWEEQAKNRTSGGTA